MKDDRMEIWSIIADFYHMMQILEQISMKILVTFDSTEWSCNKQNEYKATGSRYRENMKQKNIKTDWLYERKENVNQMNN